MKDDAARFAALWWLYDMRAPRFEHKAEDSQASIAESMAGRARRPSSQEAIAFCLRLWNLLLQQSGEGPFELATEIVPKGLLSEALDAAGFAVGSKAHLLSWFTVMQVTDDVIVVRHGPRGFKAALWQRGSPSIPS